MKTINIFALSLMALLATNVLASDSDGGNVIPSPGDTTPTITGVNIQQHWPWDGKIDVKYTLNATTEKTTPVFSVKFYGYTGSGDIFELTTVTGDGASGITLGEGEKRSIWDASVDKPGMQSILQIAVEATDVTDEATYIGFDLTTGKSTYSGVPPWETTISSVSSKDYQFFAGHVGDTVPWKDCQIWFRRVERGTFTMGKNDAPTGYSIFAGDPSSGGSGPSDDSIKHQVTITKAFYIAIFELTLAQRSVLVNGSQADGMWTPASFSYDELRGNTYGSTWPNKTDHRVDRDSIIGKLRKRSGDSLMFDIPTEAQWEMACRDKGDGTYFEPEYFNNGGSSLDDVAWHHGNSDLTVKNVGQKAASAIGTYDMHGNAEEWCLDWLGDNTSYVTDPEGPPSGDYGYRIFRGGSVYGDEVTNNATFRSGTLPDIGLPYYGCRLVLIP